MKEITLDYLRRKEANELVEYARRLEAENAELKDVIADLTAELERRTAGLGEMPF